MDFKTIDELYNRLLPALKIKVTETKKLTEKDIWDYLTKTIWINSNDLTLAEMVNDILKCDITKIKI